MFPVNDDWGDAVVQAIRTMIDNCRIVPVIWFGNRWLSFNAFELMMRTVKPRADILLCVIIQHITIQIEEVSGERINFIEAVKHGLKQSYVDEVMQFYHAG